MRAELRRRWRTWALVAPVFLGAYFLGGGGTFVLAAGLGVIAVSEFVRMAGSARGTMRCSPRRRSPSRPSHGWLRTSSTCGRRRCC